MTNAQTVCGSETIERFLKDQMTENEQLNFESHLDACQSCQQMLQASTAAPSWWDDTREFLTDAERESELKETLSFLNPTDNPRMMGRFGGYEIAGLIGQGGMGMVLKGFDESLNRYAAIKVLAPQLATRGSARSRFAREAQAAAAVVHDNVIAIHGVSHAAGLPFLVMPYVRGESLQKRVDRDGPMTATEVVRIAHQIASGLSAAHAQGLVHRDIKPANILLPEGVQRVLITDFGLARTVDDSCLTGTGTISGTPQFMSPEQARGDVVDTRSDLFSLGTVMYVMCTGHNPYRAENPFGVLRRIIEDKPRSIRESNPEIPNWLQAIVNRLQQKEPDDRFQSASEVAELLERCLAHLQNPVVELPLELKLELKVTRGKRLAQWCSIAGLAVLAAALAFAFLWPPRQAPDQTPEHAAGIPGTQDSALKSSLLESSELNGTSLATNELLAERKRLAMAIAVQQEIDEESDKRRREHLTHLSNQMMQLRQEGNLVGAIEVEIEILETLRSSDKDHQQINQLRLAMIDARLEGDHDEAKRLNSEIAKVETNLAERYIRLRQLEALDDQCRELAKSNQRHEFALGEEDYEKAAHAEQKVRLLARQLETDYLALDQVQAGSDLSLDRQKPMAGTSQSMELNERHEFLQKSTVIENELLDARIGLQNAELEVEQAELTHAHSLKLYKKGFVSAGQANKEKLDIAKKRLLVDKARNNLNLIESRSQQLKKQFMAEEADAGTVAQTPIAGTSRSMKLNERHEFLQKTTVIENELLDARIGLQNAELEVEQAELTHAHSLKLYKKGFVTVGEMKKDQLSLAQKMLLNDKARNNLKLAESRSEHFKRQVEAEEAQSTMKAMVDDVKERQAIMDRRKVTEVEMDSLLKRYSASHPEVVKVQEELDMIDLRLAHFEAELKAKSKSNSKPQAESDSGDGPKKPQPETEASNKDRVR